VREGQGVTGAQIRRLWSFGWANSRRICVGHNCKFELAARLVGTWPMLLSVARYGQTAVDKDVARAGCAMLARAFREHCLDGVNLCGSESRTIVITTDG
jgi:hypothetical protein